MFDVMPISYVKLFQTKTAC